MSYYLPMLDIKAREWLEKTLPEVFLKKDLGTLTDGVLTAVNMRQILFLHPEMRPFPGHHIGRKVLVYRDEFINWLEKYNERIRSHPNTIFGRVLRTNERDEREAGSAGETFEREGR